MVVHKKYLCRVFPAIHGIFPFLCSRDHRIGLNDRLDTYIILGWKGSNDEDYNTLFK